MIRVLLLMFTFVIAAAACPGCPTPANPSTPTPYMIARASVQGAQILLMTANAGFELWCANVAPSKCAEARPMYAKASLAVADGLEIAWIGIDTAEQQSEKFDLMKLLAQAEAAWGPLVKLLTDLGVNMSGVPGAPSSMPTRDVKAMAPVLKLPLSLLPSRKH